KAVTLPNTVIATVYSTSQFLGVAIGGALGGWVDGFFDSQTVFLLGALLAMLWLLVASTMSEPPYVSSLRVEVPDGVVVDSAATISVAVLPNA
ncbi:MFS transporter, partial [Klebsiella pneumoniae]|nr:MFS transporter [Klebsiella pneumoniae]